MKGLLLKDFYMTIKYCKVLLLFIILFASMAIIDPTNLFFLFYPVLTANMLPITIMGYDEQCHWNVYGQVFPYSKKQHVSVKYLMSLFFIVGLWLIMCGVQYISILIHGTGADTPENYLFFLLLVLSGSLFCSGIILPFVFKYGTHKGRYAYILAIMFICGGGAAGSTIITESFRISLSINALAFSILSICIAVFLLSWGISVKIYEKREL